MKIAVILAVSLVAFLHFGGAAYCQQPDSSGARLVSGPPPRAPKEAKDSSLGGLVRVLVSLDEAGNPVAVRDVVGRGIICSGVDRTDVVAIRNVAKNLALQSKFSPAMQNGQGVASSIWVAFDFPGKKGTSDFNFDKKGEKHFSAANAPPSGYRGPVNTKDPPETLSGGVLNGKASELPRPSYPPAARAVRVSGSVPVQVLIDEQGKVFMAQAVDGHPLLRANAVSSACRARFMPTLLSGEPVKVSGIITYNFVP